MQKRDWVFYGRIKQHLVQLYHFPEMGKVTIKLNGIKLIEEELPAGEEKKYSFFVDEELCELQLSIPNPANPKSYNYEFINHQFSTTAVGKQRKQRDRLEKIGFAALAILLFGTIFIPLMYYIFNENKDKNDLNIGGMSVPATITRIETHRNITPSDSLPKVNTTLFYTYKVAEKDYYGEKKYYMTLINDTTYTNVGLPLLKGDQFEVLFVPTEPEKNSLRLYRPTDIQLQRYWLSARDKCLANPFFDTVLQNSSIDKALYCDCIILELFNHAEVESLTRIYNQLSPPTQHKYYNKTTFDNFIQQREQRILLDNCLHELNKSKK